MIFNFCVTGQAKVGTLSCYILALPFWRGTRVDVAGGEFPTELPLRSLSLTYDFQYFMYVCTYFRTVLRLAFLIQMWQCQQLITKPTLCSSD